MWTKEEIVKVDPSGAARKFMWDRLLFDWNDHWDWTYEDDRRLAKKEWAEAHNYGRNDHIKVAMNNLTYADIERAKEMLTTNDGMIVEYNPCAPITYFDQPPIKNFNLAPLSEPYPGSVPSKLNWKKKPREQEKENNMGYAEANLETEQRNHLRRRLDRVQNDKYDAARETYHMNQGNEFKGMTKDEVTSALVLGQYLKLNDNAFTSDGKFKSYTSSWDSLIIVDPKRDEAGLKKAGEAIDAAYTAAKDAVLVLPLTDGLKALQAFEAMTF